MDNLLEQGIAAYKAGKRDEARKVFIALVKQEPDNERAWGWMYMVANNDKERIHCMKQALRINPRNEKARQLLDQLLTPSSSTSVSSSKQVNSLNSALPKRSNNTWKIGLVVISLIFICVVIPIGGYIVYNLTRPVSSIQVDSDAIGQATTPSISSTVPPTDKPTPKLDPLSALSASDLEKAVLSPDDLTFAGLNKPSDWTICNLSGGMLSELDSSKGYQSYVKRKYITSKNCSDNINGDSVEESIYIFSDIRGAQRFAETAKELIKSRYDIMVQLFGPYDVQTISDHSQQIWLIRTQTSFEGSQLLLQTEEAVIILGFSNKNKLVIDDLTEVALSAIDRLRALQGQTP